MIKGIIFDMDGVLVDSERQSDEGWKWAAGQLGIEMPKQLIDSFKGASAELCRKRFDDYFQGKADYLEAKKLRTQHVYDLRESEGLPVKKGVGEVFEYLKSSSIKCAVATSTRRESAERTLNNIGVYKYLDAVVYGDEVKNGKPEPDIFLHAAEAIGVKACDAIVVEDSVNGIKAGFAAGMRVVHVPDTIEVDDEIRKLTYAVCEDLTGVIDVVDSINKPLVNRRRVLNAFAEYVRNYDPSDGKIKLKIDHTYRVAGLCRRIAESLGLTGTDVDTAWLMGMLHDIGRFEQIRRYGTFNDAQSVNHADFGADLLFREGLIDKFACGYMQTDDGLLELAIRQHNKYRIKEGLGGRELMFCNILRDADKIDILKVNVDVPLEIIYDVTTQELRNSVITKEVLDSFYRRETVLKSIRRSAVDNVVGHISLLFELVYPVSLKIARQQGYIFKMLDFGCDVEATRKQFDDMRAYVVKFIEERERQAD